MAGDGSRTRMLVIIAIVGVFVLCGLGAAVAAGGWFFYRASSERAAAEVRMEAMEAERAARRRAWLESLPADHRSAMRIFDDGERAALDLVTAILAGEDIGPDAAVADVVRELRARHHGLAAMESPSGETTETDDGRVEQVTIDVLLAWNDDTRTTVRVTLDHAGGGTLTASAIEIVDAAK